MEQSNGCEEIKVFIATPEHAEEISRLNELFNDVRISSIEMARRLGEVHAPEIAIIAWCKRGAVAFAGLRIVTSLFYDSPHAEITELFVQEDFRQRGIGRLLIGKSIEVAKDRGATELKVITDLENFPARVLYEKSGFTEINLCLTKSLDG